MTRAERFLAVVGVTVVASAVLLTVYVKQSNPADAQASGCAPQRIRLGQTLDQVRFSTSAAHAVATGLSDTARTRDEYLKMIVAARQKLSDGRLTPRTLVTLRRNLGQASWILNAQDQPLQQAQAIITEKEREIAAALPIVSEASRDMRDEDCAALSLTLARSGWPKDRLLRELSDAARLNSQVNDKLASALSLILQAQHDLRASVATK